MSEPMLAPVPAPFAWGDGGFREKGDVAVRLNEAEISALLEGWRRGTLLSPDAAGDIFRTEPWAGRVAACRAALYGGPGVIILGGFPVDEIPLTELEIGFLALGNRLGRAVSQSNLGELVGHVTDVGGKDRRERAYRNSRELTFHTDRADVVGMLCIRNALEGGVSGFCSVADIFNAILAERPDLLPPLIAGFPYHRFGEQGPGEPAMTAHRVPIFSFHGGRLSTVFLRTYIEMAAKESGRALAPAESEALDLFEALARRADIERNFLLEPGEAVLFNNCAVLHRRTAFEDVPGSGEGASEPSSRGASGVPGMPGKRLLLRLWLTASEDDWPLSEAHRRYKARGIEKREHGSTYYRGDALEEPVLGDG